MATSVAGIAREKKLFRLDDNVDDRNDGKTVFSDLGSALRKRKLRTRCSALGETHLIRLSCDVPIPHYRRKPLRYITACPCSRRSFGGVATGPARGIICRRRTHNGPLGAGENRTIGKRIPDVTTIFLSRYPWSTGASSARISRRSRSRAPK